MNKTIAGAAALVLLSLSSTVFAADPPTMEERCKAIAEQHGMAAAEIDAWVQKCMDHTRSMMQQHKQGEPKKSDGMQDPQGKGHKDQSGADKQ